MAFRRIIKLAYNSDRKIPIRKEMKHVLLTAFFLLTCIGAADRAKNVAIVKMVRGQADVVSDGASQKISKGMWLREGATVKTSDRSFVRLSFIDKSTMNVGPNSEMKIEKFSDKEASVINVLSGKIRSQVSKNYLNIEKDKSKMFVKSKAAVMGIRGTDFIFSANRKSGATTAVLFEGSVVFNRLGAKDSGKDLESIVERGRRIRPGQFSVTRMDMKRPTVPAKMSSSQLRALYKNKNFDDNKALKRKQAKRSVVPPGLTGAAVSSSGSGVEEGLKGIVDTNRRREPGAQRPDEKSKGFISGDDIKPVDGSIVHIDSGTIIPLGSDSQYDANSKEWVSSTFEVDSKGQIIPPEGYRLTEDGSLVKVVEGGELKEINLEIKPLDQTQSLEEMEPIEGPAPAGDSELPQGEGLDRPPIMPGDSITRENLPGVDGGVLPPSSPVRFRIGKDGAAPTGQ